MQRELFSCLLQFKLVKGRLEISERLDRTDQEDKLHIAVMKTGIGSVVNVRVRTTVLKNIASRWLKGTKLKNLFLYQKEIIHNWVRRNS